MAGKFEIFEDKAGKYRFRLKAANGEIILASQGYIQKSSAKGGIDSVKTNAPLDERFERKVNDGGQYMFNLKSGNHEVIGTSEQYTSSSSRNKGIESVKTNAPTAPIIETS